MSPALLHTARFLMSVNHPHGLPTSEAPEIAFAGRSNAGKSSAINTLCQQKRLAFTSKTPGRTQQINYFSLGGADRIAGHLVDLPGYGYARVPAAAKAHWAQLLSHYLRTRSQLRGLILLMDARHPCTALDTQMIEWFIPTGNPIHILLTKADKLSRQQGLAAQRATQQRLDKYARSDTRSMLSVQLFSALKRSGLDTVYQVIERWLA
ncbi:GTP-binding protein, EngB family [Candidatus Glomeribacter gigasporarum BEG34]|uniref:Probable GTP-binding protein EngB n=1 Tax=Candidatus Glomeribacter gigasporarum BEG34 TaxID=1070319 RepID=G2J953_9BURK|nr:ribosome biogenesis GTP-binding protein YihA/YsxC [Candidatus Glomeribacter gigasporarum]CCD29300.1 GTP-binding protein, EngB family [Candidatus Glomeribacter gigasporarum BEG34]